MQIQARSQGFEKGVRFFPLTIVIEPRSGEAVGMGGGVTLLQSEGLEVLIIENFENKTYNPAFYRLKL
ncbi:hypothetical protein DPMN_113773 [Dreissena polymorpha]|uniref:Uncharacterized protein n=1 Tax=Dreissena polymorpha TaxID=45954 RepID=A0A9D4KJM8_DREPO|nr:hypothetical protein DPMN_113773 [Dreissena polymorpha]